MNRQSLWNRSSLRTRRLNFLARSNRYGNSQMV